MTRLTDSGRDPLLWWCHFFRWKAVLSRVGVNHFKGDSLDDALMTRSFKYWEDLQHDKLFLTPHQPPRHPSDTHPSQGTLWP